MKRTVTKISAAAAALVIAAGTGAATYAALDDGGTTAVAPSSSSGTAQTVKDGALTIGQVYDRTNASVVEITVTTQAPADGPMGSGTAQAQGSGFVYDSSGHVITNAHVVDGAESVPGVVALVGVVVVLAFAVTAVLARLPGLRRVV